MEVKGEVTSETFKKLDGSLSLADLYQIGTCEVADGLLAIIEGRHKRLKVLFKQRDQSNRRTITLFLITRLNSNN